MNRVSCKQDNWTQALAKYLAGEGYAIVEDMVDEAQLAVLRDRLYSARGKITIEIGADKLKRAGEYGVLRIMMKFEREFLALLENPAMLAIVDATVSNTGILHLQNGFILPSYPPGETPANFQNHFHRDFPQNMNGYLASVNVLMAIDEFTSDNGGTTLVPGTQQEADKPEQAYMEKNAISAQCKAGSALVFDSTLWHASGINVSGKDRLAINHQFTRSFIKQQIDYCRALPAKTILGLLPRSQQLLGWYTRTPTSLEEYYRPEDERLYRKNQG